MSSCTATNEKIAWTVEHSPLTFPPVDKIVPKDGFLAAFTMTKKVANAFAHARRWAGKNVGISMVGGVSGTFVLKAWNPDGKVLESAPLEGWTETDTGCPTIGIDPRYMLEATAIGSVVRLTGEIRPILVETETPHKTYVAVIMPTRKP